MKRLGSLCGLISVLSFAGELASEELRTEHDTPPATILILTFENSTGRQKLDAVVAAVPDLVAAFLVSGTDRVRVVDRRVLEKIYEEKSLTWQGLLADGSARRTGALSRAKYILRGSLRRRDRGRGAVEAVEVQAFLHETDSTRLVKSFAAHGAPGEIVKLCREVASEVAAFFREDLPPMEDLPLDEDPKKSLLMIHGLSSFHNGAFHRSMTCFLKVLERDPSDAAAHFWLARSFLGAGLEVHAKIELEQFLAKFPRSDRATQVKSLLKSLEQKEASSHDQ